MMTIFGVLVYIQNKIKGSFFQAYSPYLINLLVPSVKKINIGNPGIQVNNWGGPPIKGPPLILLVTWISSIGFSVPGNQQINANMVNCRLFID